MESSGAKCDWRVRAERARAPLMYYNVMIVSGSCIFSMAIDNWHAL